MGVSGPDDSSVSLVRERWHLVIVKSLLQFALAYSLESLELELDISSEMRMLTPPSTI
jgi:hypothetical protein